MGKAAIIGIGNPLMGDDGAGVAVLELIKPEDLPEGMEIIELGTGGINLLHVLARFDAAVIVDAGNFGGQPGEIKVFQPEEVKSVKGIGYSLHDWDMFTTIETSRKLGECPDNLVIIAIQPEEVRTKMGLSKSVEDKLPELVEIIKITAAKLHPRSHKP